MKKGGGITFLEYQKLRAMEYMGRLEKGSCPNLLI